jgi:hypothetical protein
MHEIEPWGRPKIQPTPDGRLGVSEVDPDAELTTSWSSDLPGCRGLGSPVSWRSSARSMPAFAVRNGSVRNLCLSSLPVRSNRWEGPGPLGGDYNQRRHALSTRVRFCA